jgi:WXXGXW repeat (2 copies)
MRILKSLGFLLLASIPLAMPAPSRAQIAIGVSVRVGPPVLPVYAQPICPGPGYIWTPGYWAHDEDDYYWVPGTWVMAPEPGLLWTPGYWGFSDGLYVWHGGYWGPHVGFYGGINYGYGYTGVGFWGGEWRGREFVYNRAVTNVNVTVIHNYYNRTVVVNNVNRVSYNGGPRGIQVRESERERIAAREHHFEARREQIEHEHAARADRSQWASVNHGRPAVAASSRAGDFHRNVVAARNEREVEHRADRAAERRDERRDDHRGDRVVEHRDDHRGDRAAGNSSEASRGFGRNDRPTNAVNRDSERLRPNSAPSNNTRQAREVRPVQNNQPSRGPQGEARGNPHVDRGAAQHSNGSHENAPHSNNKPEHGKPEKP